MKKALFSINDHGIVIANDVGNYIARRIQSVFEGVNNVNNNLFRGWSQYPLTLYPTVKDSDFAYSNSRYADLDSIVLFLVHPTDFGEGLDKVRALQVLENKCAPHYHIIVDVDNVSNDSGLDFAKKNKKAYYQLNSQNDLEIIDLFTYVIEQAQAKKALKISQQLQPTIFNRIGPNNPFEAIIQRFCDSVIFLGGSKQEQLAKFSEFYHAIKNAHPDHQHQTAINFINSNIEPLRHQAFAVFSINKNKFLDPFTQILNSQPEEFLHYFNSFQGWLNQWRSCNSNHEGASDRELMNLSQHTVKHFRGFFEALRLPLFASATRDFYQQEKAERMLTHRRSGPGIKSARMS